MFKKSIDKSIYDKNENDTIKNLAVADYKQSMLDSGTQESSNYVSETEIEIACAEKIRLTRRHLSHILQEQKHQRENIFLNFENNTAIQDIANATYALEDGTSKALDQNRLGYEAATTDLHIATVDYNEFRQKNNISRLAEYPISAIHHLAVVVMFVLGEAMLNAAFFDNGTGLLAAYLLAITCSLINVAVPFGLGYAYRNHNSLNIITKILGYSCLIIFICYSLYLNALIACYRAAIDMTAGDATASSTPAQSFAYAVKHAIGFLTFQSVGATFLSFLIFAIGFMGAFLGFVKGYFADDVFPEYGSIDRALKNSKNAQEELEQVIREEALQCFQSARGELDKIREKFMDLQLKFRETITVQENATSNYHHQVLEYVSMANNYLKLYRNMYYTAKNEIPPENTVSKVLNVDHFKNEISFEIRSENSSENMARNARLNEIARNTNNAYNEEIKKLRTKKSEFENKFKIWRESIIADISNFENKTLDNNQNTSIQNIESPPDKDGPSPAEEAHSPTQNASTETTDKETKEPSFLDLESSQVNMHNDTEIHDDDSLLHLEPATLTTVTPNRSS